MPVVVSFEPCPLPAVSRADLPWPCPQTKLLAAVVRAPMHRSPLRWRSLSLTAAAAALELAIRDLKALYLSHKCLHAAMRPAALLAVPMQVTARARALVWRSRAHCRSVEVGKGSLAALLQKSEEAVEVEAHQEGLPVMSLAAEASQSTSVPSCLVRLTFAAET